MAKKEEWKNNVLIIMRTNVYICTSIFMGSNIFVADFMVQQIRRTCGYCFVIVLSLFRPSRFHRFQYFGADETSSTHLFSMCIFLLSFLFGMHPSLIDTFSLSLSVCYTPQFDLCSKRGKKLLSVNWLW